MQWFCSFLTPNFNGLWLHLRVADNSEFHSSPEAFGHMSPHCRFSDLGPFRLRIFSAQEGNRTRAHGDESNPLEISVSSAMKGEPRLATGHIALGALHWRWIKSARDQRVKCNERRTTPCHRAYSIRGSTPFHSRVEVPSPKLVSSEDRTGARAPSASYCSTKGVAPLHTAPPVPAAPPHCPKTKERKFNLGMLNLYETHFIALFSVKYPNSV